MPGDLATITFTGITDIEQASVCKVRGVSPSLATLVCLIQGSLPPTTGTLTITQGGQSESWPNAAILHANRRHIREAKGHRISVQVADRRWKWKWQTISGVYNVRLEDGTVSETNKKSVKELADLIFQKLGETATTTPLPDDLYPPIHWEATRCDIALHLLLQLAGCDVTVEGAQTLCVKRGTGAGLPAGGQPIEPSVVMTAGPQPDKFIVEGGPILAQSKFKMQAVALDNDGSWKKVDEVSYKPSAGWGSEWPMGFEGISNETDRALARQTVWKCFAVETFADGTLSIPELTDVDQSKITQFLPLRERLLESDNDHNQIARQNVPYLEAKHWFSEDGGASIVRYEGRWKVLDAEAGIIEVETPLFNIASQAITAPEVYLTIAHHVREPDTDGEVTGTWESGSGSSPVTESHPELVRTIIQEYSGTSRTGAIDNQATVEAEANKYIAIMQQRYAPAAPPTARKYGGIVTQALDGAIAQVVYAREHGEIYTIISRGYEDDVYMPSERERELILLASYVPPQTVKPDRGTAGVLGGCVLQDALHAVDGRIAGTLSALGSQTMRIWRKVNGTWADTGIDITVHDALLGSSATMTDKWRVLCRWNGEHYKIIAAACEADTSSTVWGT